MDVVAERERITKEIVRITIEANKASAKLANSGFIERAPEKVVEQEKDRLSGFNATLKKLQEQLEKLSSA